MSVRGIHDAPNEMKPMRNTDHMTHTMARMENLVANSSMMVHFCSKFEPRNIQTSNRAKSADTFPGSWYDCYRAEFPANAVQRLPCETYFRVIFKYTENIHWETRNDAIPTKKPDYVRFHVSNSSLCDSPIGFLVSNISV